MQDALSHLATVHAIDLPGHGLTDIPRTPLQLDAMARWVEAYMDAAGIERAVVVGWSMGGGVALSLSLQAPSLVAALVLIGSVGAAMAMPFTLGLLRYRGVAEAMLRAARSPAWRRALLRGVFHPSFTINDTIVNRYWEAWRVRGRIGYLRALMRTIDIAPLESRLGDVAVPTYVVHGEQDRLVPVSVGRKIAEKVAGARLHVLPSTGHSPHHEEPAAVRAAIRSALAHV